MEEGAKCQGLGIIHSTCPERKKDPKDFKDYRDEEKPQGLPTSAPTGLKT